MSHEGAYDVYYEYTYFYNNIGGDSYNGYGYADASDGFQAGQVISKTNETGNNGYYSITSTQNYGVDNGYQDNVYITGYSEPRNYTSFIVPPTITNINTVGTLGSEQARISGYNDGFFGNGYYEADYFADGPGPVGFY